MQPASASSALLTKPQCLHVTLLDAAFEKKTHWFVSIQVETGQSRKKYRTEVSKQTKEPIFKTVSFYFRLSGSPESWAPTISAQAFEVVTQKSLVRSTASASVVLREGLEPAALASLLSGKKITIVLPMKIQITGDAGAAGSILGKIALAMAVSDIPPFPLRDGLDAVLERDALRPASPEHASLITPPALSSQRVFSFTLHAALNLPAMVNASTAPSAAPPASSDSTSAQSKYPSPFVTIKTTRDAAEKRPARAATFSASGTRNVNWNERLKVELGRDDLEEGIGLLVSLIDHSSKRFLSKAVLPADELLVGETYNIALVLNTEGSCLLLSITPERNAREEAALFAGGDRSRIEVCIKGFGESLPTHFPTLDLLAVLHLVQEPDAYLRMLKKLLEKDAGGPALPFFSVQLPEPLEGLVPISSHKISAPALSSERQSFTWDLPKKEVSSAREKGLAVVIELFRYEFPAATDTTDQDATISFYGYAVAPLAGLADPALADGAPLSLPEIPITIVGSKPIPSSGKKGSTADTSGTATVIIEARRLGSEAAVKAAEAREKRLSQGPLSGSGMDSPLPAISVQPAVRASPYPGSATPPQLEEGQIHSLRLKHSERENAKLKKEIAQIKAENEKLKHAQSGPSLGRELAVLLTEVQERMRVEAEKKATEPRGSGGSVIASTSGMEELLSLMQQNLRLTQSIDARLKQQEEHFQGELRKALTDAKKSSKPKKETTRPSTPGTHTSSSASKT